MAELHHGPPEVALLVGRAQIHGASALEACAPAEVHVAAGQRLRIILQFHLIEGSRSHETYRFRIESRLGAQRAPAKVVRFGDHWGWPDEAMGFLAQTYVMANPGEYPLDVTLSAHYGTRRWRLGNGASEEVSAAQQHIRVIVT